ncbi:MAG: hypothetical protein QNJ98_06065 [Planctomycetota bacterium]|nr:hypothetical protein [Planctomycetota bacterium]
MHLPSRIVLLAAALTLFAGLFAAPDAHAETLQEQYFFKRRPAAHAEFALVGPHTTLDATNAAIRWSMDNGYEVQWEADGSAPMILVERTVAHATVPTKVVVVYVTPAYSWYHWSHYRTYWKGWKVKVRWRGWSSYYGYKLFKKKVKHYDDWKWKKKKWKNKKKSKFHWDKKKKNKKKKKAKSKRKGKRK